MVTATAAQETKANAPGKGPGKVNTVSESKVKPIKVKSEVVANVEKAMAEEEASKAAVAEVTEESKDDDSEEEDESEKNIISKEDRPYGEVARVKVKKIGKKSKGKAAVEYETDRILSLKSNDLGELAMAISEFLGGDLAQVRKAFISGANAIKRRSDAPGADPYEKTVDMILANTLDLEKLQALLAAKLAAASKQ